MSDQTQSAQTNATNDVPRTRKPSNKRLAHTDVIDAYGRAHPKDPTAKGLRRTLRANKDADPAYKAHIKNTPWPAHKRVVLQRLFKNDAAFLRELRKVK